MPKVCNGCEFLNIDEYEQDLIKVKFRHCPPHICNKYNKRVIHFPYSEPYIHPCEECEKGDHLNSLINGTPVADVVEVIRCKDCQYFYQDGNIKVCKHWNCHSTTDDAYCSCAKKKDDERWWL